MDANHSPADRFFERLSAHVAAGSLSKLVLAKPRPAGDELQRITVRPLALKGRPHLSFVETHRTRDLTHNHPVEEGVALLRGLVGERFQHAHLLATDEDLELRYGKRGTPVLHRSAAERAAATGTHDREKRRWMELDTPFLAALGVTNERGELVPAMARKWKQINKFVEVLDHAYESSPLAKTTGPVRVADFGSGKGYLTFAVHHHLTRARGREVKVTGVELREDMVALCGGVAERLRLDGLRFEAGDVRTRTPEPIDVMIALHACDTATDHAIHLGIEAGASIILCSPCCHKELRPQMKSPALLAPMLQHGLHLGQQAEMLTDALRALLLQAHGYDTQVFEFVSLEHTSKNKMILAVKRDKPLPAEPVLEQIRAIKDFYAVREQCLETLLLSKRT